MDGQIKSKIEQIDKDIETHENEIKKLKKRKEALLNSSSHSPVEQKPNQTTSKITTVLHIPKKINEKELIEYSKKIAEKNSKGGFLGKGKVVESPVGWIKFLYPYFDVEVEVTRTEVEKRGWFKKEKVTKTVKGRLAVDSVTGALVDVGSNGISYKYAFLKNLDHDEVRLLYWVGSGTFTTSDLRGLGQSDSKSRRIADGLATKGILSRKATRPIQYTTKYPYPYNPEVFVSLIEQYKPIESETQDNLVSPRISDNFISSYLDKYWNKCNFVSNKVVYYPYYSITYKRENHTRSEIIDAVTGLRQQYLEKFVSFEPINTIS